MRSTTTGGTDKRAYLLLAVAGCIAWGGAFLAAESQFWDDWVMRNGDTIGLYHDLGLPWMGYVVLGLTLLGPWAFKVIGLGSAVFVGCVAYRISDGIFGLRPVERWLLAALVIVLPLNAAKVSVGVLVTYSLSLAAFFAAWNLLVRASPARPGRARYVISAVLFLASFTTGSLLLFFIVPIAHLAFLVISDSGGLWRGALRFVKQFWYLLATPVVFWVLRSIFLEPTGMYANYNSFISLGRINRENFFAFGALGSATAVGIALLVWVALSRSQRYSGNGAAARARVRLDAAMLTALGVGVGALGVVMFATRESPSVVNGIIPYALTLGAVGVLVRAIMLLTVKRDQAVPDETGRQIIPLLAVGILVLLLGVTPYLLVGKLPTFDVWETRHQLLMPVGVSLILVGTVRAITREASLVGARVLSIGIVGFFIVASASISLALVADWQKQRQIMSAMSELPAIRDAGLVVFVDLAPELNYDSRPYSFYEYTGWMISVFGDQRRLGIDSTLVPSVLDGSFYKYISADQRYGFGEYRHTQAGVVVDVKAIEGATWLGLLVGEQSVSLHVSTFTSLADLP